VPFWWYKLNKDPYYQDLLKNRWAQCRRANMREDRIYATIDSMATQLTAQGAMNRNSQAWPRWGQYVWPNQYIAQNFNDEVTLATALTQIMKTPEPARFEVELYGTDIPRLHTLISGVKESGYVSPDLVRDILSCAGIPLVPELVSTSKDGLSAFADRVGYPVVAKVVGPVHKSDVGGVTLNIRSREVLSAEFDRMMQIQDATAVMVQKMLKGTELFIGAKYEERFGHVVLCGLGGIFVEVLRDVSSGLAPLSYEEAYSMIRSLRAYKILKGTRGQKGINERKYAEIIVRLSTLLRFATEIKEMDINPLLADGDDVIAVDARIRVEK